MELANQAESFRKRGLEVAAVIRDPSGKLKGFAAKHSIGYPLLADPDFVVIRRFGLVDPSYAVGHMAYGVPRPVTLIVDAKGTVQSKFFEEKVTHRRTAASVLMLDGAPGTGGVEAHADHFTLRTSSSNLEVAPGQRFTLALEFEMEARHHAYAPGAKGYRALDLRIEPQPVLEVHETRFPPAGSYYFAPLKETVPVYEGHFRVLKDVTAVIEDSRYPELSKAGGMPLAITGTLDYQVCSDRVCYPPASLPLRWAITIRPWAE